MSDGRWSGRDELPTTFVPRWLAAVVLAALLASGALTAWLVLAPDGDTPHAAVPTPPSQPAARAEE